MDGLERLAHAQAGVGNGGPPPLEDVEPRTLAQVVEAFERRLYLPDHGMLLVTLGGYAANCLDGDPVWLVHVSPPSSGKTEILAATYGLRAVYRASELTVAALLSGTPKRDRTKDAAGGLLRLVGEFGVLVVKDLTSILSMRRDAQTEVLGALREVYDGSYTRHVGTDGGRTLHWQGKMGMLAGCTETIDRRHGVMAAMGERFVLYRPERLDPEQQVDDALAGAGDEGEMRAELAAAVAGLFRDGPPCEPRRLDVGDRKRLGLLAVFSVRCRSAVERDGYSREIELVPQAELPARLGKALARVLAGFDAIGLERERAWLLVAKLALDSIPALRLAVIDALYEANDELETDAIGVEVRHPTATTRRALEDLEAHGLVERDTGGKAHRWRLSEWCRTHYQRVRDGTVPEIQGQGDIALKTPTSRTTENRERSGDRCRCERPIKSPRATGWFCLKCRKPGPLATEPREAA